MRAIVATVASMSLMPIVFLRLPSGNSFCEAPELVDHVDRLVRELAVVDVARRKLDRRLDRFVRVADLVMILVIGLQPLQDLDRVGQRRLVHVDLLEAADERAVLLEELPVFLVGRGADAAELAGGERRLQQIGGVHRSAGRRAGADHRVDLVDEHDGVLVRLKLLDDLLQPLLEIAAIARAGEKRAHIEREDGGALQNLRHVALDDLLGEAFGDRRLADAGVAHIERVVLVAPAEHLDGALQLKLAPDQRIDLAGARLGVQVDAPGFERALLAARRLLGVVGLAARLLARAAHGANLFRAWTLGDAVRDVVHRVVARHVLLLQEIGGVAFALGEDGDEHVGAGDLLAA